MKFLTYFLNFILLTFFLKAQNPTLYKNQPKQQKKNTIIYELKSSHIPLIVVSSLLYSFGNNLVRKKTPLQEQDILLLSRSSVNSIDRFATYRWSPTFSTFSDITLVISATSAPLLFLEKKIRKEWFTIGFMYFEATIWSYGITQTTKGLNNRLRPFLYNPDAPLEKKIHSDAKNSFFSGHTSLTATYSFLTYKIYSDFFPKSELKPYVLATSIALPLITATNRVLAGKHYLSDVAVGYAVGALIGYGLPYLFHKKNKPNALDSSIKLLISPISLVHW